MTEDRTVSAKIDILRRHWLFASLAPAELERLAAHLRTDTHAAGTTIFRKGDPGLSVMAVRTGRVKISIASADGKEVVLNIIDAGDVFGEIALLDGRARTADATTMEPSELLILDRRDMLPFLERHPAVMLKLIEVLCGRIRNTSEQLEDAVFLVQSARLAKTLLRLAREYGQKAGDGIHIDLKLSQREIGTLVGMRREAMNRQLTAWREAGLVLLEGGKITIPDVAAFETLAEDLIWRGLE